jgi:putative heme-binding domain-containing protein
MLSRLPARYRFAVVAGAVLISAGLVRWLVASAAQPGAGDRLKPVTTSAARTPWTTSRVVGSPEPPPPYKVVRAFANLKFDKPLLLARAPGSNRLFLGEQDGVLYSFINKPDAKAELFCDLRKEIKTAHLLPQAKGVQHVYGLVFHPDFEKNRQCFVCYTLHGPTGNLEDGTRVSRFRVTDAEPPRLDAGSEEIILTFLQGGHNGGDLHFGPDGMLYISTGDATDPNPPDQLDTGQDVSDLLSSILRIDVNRRDPGKNYAVPKDNPFAAAPLKLSNGKLARPEIWAYGFRNPWRMSFDRQTGALFVGDVGWELWEMVHRIEKGGNYGWAAMEGPQPIKPNKVGPTPIIPPLIELPHTIACSVTGGYVYRGKRFPELRGAYLFGDWETRRMWAARFDGDHAGGDHAGGDRLKEMPEITRPSVRIVAFGEDNDGEIYFLDHDGGTIHTLEHNDAGAKNVNFPTALSATGLFASVKDNVPAPGVIPFAPNSRQWLDGATAQHWAAFPGTAHVTLHAPPGKPIPGMVSWHNFGMHFPENAVLVRTISLNGRRIETQLLHFDGVDWRGYSYAWRDDQSDADLIPPDGDEREVHDGMKQRVWQFHSRSQCLSCHSAWSDYALAFQPEQLNREGADGRNQLVAMMELGVIRRVSREGKPLPPLDAAGAAKEKRLVDPHDDKQPLEARARAYLHANCGHCHSENGGGAVAVRLQFPVKVADMKAVGVRPQRGAFGLDDASIIKAGDPLASTLYYRMAKFGRDRMPHIGSELPDEFGLRLIERWIAGLDEKAKADPLPPKMTPETALTSTRTALQVARKLGAGAVPGPERDQLLAAAAKLPAGPIRDLFEGYLPAENGVRRLGSNPRPKAILALQGDSARGKALFWSKIVNCGSCHKVGDQGIPIGPDLSAIGKLRTREELLESILEPSRRVDPKFASYTVNTGDGRSISGLLLKRDEHAVVLRDAQNQEIALKATNVEDLRPSRTSLMPDGQMAGLTAQDAADLLAYLVSRR